MGAVWLWAHRDLRRRWRSVVTLALLAAIGSGIAMAAAIGAERSRVVIKEVMDERRQPDAMSVPARPDTDWTPVISLPYVDSFGLFGSTALCISELGGVESNELCTQPPVAGDWFDSIWRHDITDGRMARRPDELVVNRLAARRYDLAVGQRVHVEGIAKHRPLATAHSLGPLDDYWNARPRGRQPWGPKYRMTVVGIYRGEDALRLMNGGVEEPHFVLPLAFMRAHGDELDFRTDASFELAGGDGDVPRLTTDIARLVGPAVPVSDIHAAQRRVERSTLMESAALWAFAAAVAAATLVLVGQALSRMVRGTASEAPSLSALGMSRRQLVAALSIPGLVVAVGGAAGAVLIAIASSPAVPIGLARSFDRHPGVKFDLTILAPAVLIILIVGATIALVAAWRVVRGAGGPARRLESRPRGLTAPPDLPLPARLGIGWALGRWGRGGGSVAGPAAASIVIAVGAAVAALTIRTGIEDTLAKPERAGKVWDVVVTAPDQSYDSSVSSDPAVAKASYYGSYIVSLGKRPVRGWTAGGVGNPLDPLVLDGRLPQGSGELALGPATASDLGVGIGDRVAGSPDGDAEYRVVGKAFFPNLGGHESYDEGAWLTKSGLARIEPGPPDSGNYFVDLRDGADPVAFANRAVVAGATIETLQVVEPAGILNLRNVRTLPMLLLAFFGVLGAGAVAHALIVGSRRRRRDLAVLRALGMSRRQLRLLVSIQATTLAAIGIVVGIPLGIAAGLLAWEWVADTMPLVYVAPLAIAGVALVAIATLALLNAVAVLPGQAAARARPATDLRVE